MVLTSPVGFLFLFVWWSSFIDKRQQLSGISALVTPGKQTVCSSFAASLLAWRGPHQPRGQPSVRSLQGWQEPAHYPAHCSQGIGHWGVLSNALLCPLLLVWGRIKVRPLGVCPGWFFFMLLLPGYLWGWVAPSLEDTEENESQLLCSQGREAALSSSWPCWALGTALWLITTSFKHRGALKRQ